MGLTIEQERRRNDAMMAHMDFKPINDLYQHVESIHVVAEAIAYTSQYYDFVIKPADSLDLAVISCENASCTSGYFYLNEKIKHAIARKQRWVEGEIKCSGNDSFSHLHQSCRGVLIYRVEIIYGQ